MTISIECRSVSASQTVKTTITNQVKVVDPIVLQTTVTNNRRGGRRGVPISLQVYQDGEWVEFHRTTIDWRPERRTSSATTEPPWAWSRASTRCAWYWTPTTR
jgi:hypothetical protein